MGPDFVSRSLIVCINCGQPATLLSGTDVSDTGACETADDFFDDAWACSLTFVALSAGLSIGMFMHLSRIAVISLSFWINARFFHARLSHALLTPALAYS